jgi:hypothetical protein
LAPTVEGCPAVQHFLLGSDGIRLMRRESELIRTMQMLLKFLESKYLVSTPIEECSSLVQKALNEVGLENVIIKKEVHPSYLLVEYSPSWIGKALEIEFVFKERQGGTEVHVKWPYAREIPEDSEILTEFYKQERERKRKAERLIEKFKTKIGAAHIPER